MSFLIFLQPGYPHRTIIVDEQIESPETLTIRLEEEAARNGDLHGDSPTGLLSMSAYKPQLHGMLRCNALYHGDGAS